MRAARVIALIGVGSLALSLGITPALAQASGSIDELKVSGTVMMIPAEQTNGSNDRDAGGAGASSIWLLTDEGHALPLDEASVEELPDLAPGAQLEGVVELPLPVASAVTGAAEEAAAEGREPQSDPAVIQTAADAVAETEEALPVQEAVVSQPAVVATAGSLHDADVVFFSKPGQTGTPSTAEIQKLVERVSDYWVGQSGGKIAGISVNGIKKMELPAADVCNADKTWRAAAEAFGVTAYQNYGAPGSTRHLITLALDKSCGAGLGSVGAVLGGGVSWSNLDDYTSSRGAVVGAQTLAHELGHNFGLAHANLRSCTGSTIDASTSSKGYAVSPCADVEYGDLWNVMGMGIVGYTKTPAALAINQRETLGAAGSGMLRTVTPQGGAKQTFVLKALSADSGLRGLRVEPEAGGPLYVEYRNGTGQDAGMPQSGGSSAVISWGGRKLKVTTGVRVLKSLKRLDGPASTVLSRSSSGYSVQVMSTGQSVVPYGGTARVSVTARTASTATIRVDFADPFLQGKPTVTGTLKVGSVLTAHTGSWSPKPKSFKYRWLRNGVSISGATGSRYRLTSKDAGKKISVKVRGYRTVGAESAYSASTKTVPRVLKTVKPTITGTARVGRTLTAHRGTWKPSGVKYSYRWLRNGKSIAHATSYRYKLKSTDRGKRISVKVAGKKSGYSTASRVSKSKRIY